MSLGYAIMSLLERGDASGYELMKTFDQSVAAFWHATHPQIYRELARLEKQGWVSHKRVIQSGRPNKKVFALSKAGRAELIRWLQEPSLPAPQVNDLSTLKAFSLYLLTPERALAKIAELAEIHRPIFEERKRVEEMMRTNAVRSSGPELGTYLSLLRGVTYEDGYLKWCEWAQKAIRQASGAQPRMDRKPAPARTQAARKTLDASAR